eukprot:g3718.t1
MNSVDVDVKRKPTKYRRLKRIGKGSFGVVDLIKDVSSSKLYVMKTVSATGPDVEGARKAHREALHEAKMLSRLSHPNIVEFVEAFTVKKGTRLCIVMAYCESGDLGMRLKSAREKRQLFSELQLMEWFIQMVLAIHYLHENHVLHRDLKPHNIFLTENNKVVKVGDFGVTRSLESTIAMAQTQVGTPYYMSPELARNKPYNAKADVWALGCILYQMAALQVPFPAKNFAQLVEMVTECDPAKLPKVYSKKLSILIRGMMRKDPGRRASIDQVIRHPHVQKHLELFAKRYSGSSEESMKEDHAKSATEMNTKNGSMKHLHEKKNGNSSKSKKIVVQEQLENKLQMQEALLREQQKKQNGKIKGSKKVVESKKESVDNDGRKLKESVHHLQKSILECSLQAHDQDIEINEEIDMKRTVELVSTLRASLSKSDSQQKREIKQEHLESAKHERSSKAVVIGTIINDESNDSDHFESDLDEDDEEIIEEEILEKTK